VAQLAQATQQARQVRGLKIQDLGERRAGNIAQLVESHVSSRRRLLREGQACFGTS